MKDTPKLFSIGFLVRKYHVAPQTIRNWEDAGIIPPSHRTPGGHRRYTEEHIEALHLHLYAPTVPVYATT